MPPRSRQAGRQEGAPQGEEERRRRATPTSRARSTTQSSRSPTRRCGDRVGQCRHRRLQGLAQVHPVRRTDVRRGGGAPSHGARHEEDRRLRQGSGFRARDGHPVAGRRRARGRHDPRRHADRPQRLPPAQAAAGSDPRPETQRRRPTMARYTGPMTKKSRRLGVDLIGGDSGYERRPYPPGQHGRGRIKESEYRLQLLGRSRRPATPTVCWRSSSAATTTRPAVVPARPVTTCCSCSRHGSTTSSTAAGFARTRRHARQLVVHGHFVVNGQARSTCPSYQVSAHDVIDVRQKSVEMTPFIIARETHGERIVAGVAGGAAQPNAHSRAPAPGTTARSTCRCKNSSSSSTTPRSNPTGNVRSPSADAKSHVGAKHVVK